MLLTPALDGGLRVALGRRFSITLEVNLGYVVTGLRSLSGGERLAGIAGMVFGVDLGISVAL